MPRDLNLDLEAHADAEDLSLSRESSFGQHNENADSDYDNISSDELEEAPDEILGEVDVVGEVSEMLRELHPYAQVLGLADVDSCVELENASFEEGHRCSREKFIYRLTKCGELCLGLFTSAGPDSTQRDAATASTAKLPDSNEPKRKEILLAHIIATKTTNEKVADNDMALPSNWQQDDNEESPVGHQEFGRTLALHSLAVLPDYQKRGLGSILLKAYVQRMVEAETADRISILAYGKLVPFYESLGFTNRGKSKAEFGGGNWVDMTLEFDEIRPRPEALVEQDG